VSEDRRYPIAPDLGTFAGLLLYHPGVTPDGLQVLMAQGGGVVCAHRFDADGRYLGREFRTTDWADALSWARELGLAPATIRVRAFSTAEELGPCLRIADEPGWWDGGDLGSEEEREGLLRWWRDIGGFVLQWDGEEYTLDGSGKRFQ
jgi:hypothetical protein